MTIFPADIPNFDTVLLLKNTINYIIPMFVAEITKFISWFPRNCGTTERVELTTSY
jgi:hypothetical protein